MLRHTLPLRIAGLALAALVGVAFAGRAGPTPVGASAPGISGEVFAPQERFSLRDLRGRVVLVALFRTWCGPCRGEVADLDALQARHGARGLSVVSVTNEPREKVAKFVAATSPAHPTVLENGDSSETYGLYGGGFPMSYLIDTEGRIAWRGTWADDAEDTIEELLDALHRMPPLPNAHAGIAVAVDEERFADADGLVDAALRASALDDSTRDTLRRAKPVILRRAEATLWVAQNERNLVNRILMLRRVTALHAGLPTADAARRTLDDLRSKPNSKPEVVAIEALFELRPAYGAASDDERTAIVAAFRDRHPGTEAARRAPLLLLPRSSAK